jgi:hypothetical protein
MNLGRQTHGCSNRAERGGRRTPSLSLRNHGRRLILRITLLQSDAVLKGGPGVAEDLLPASSHSVNFWVYPTQPCGLFSARANCHREASLHGPVEWSEWRRANDKNLSREICGWADSADSRSPMRGIRGQQGLNMVNAPKRPRLIHSSSISSSVEPPE